ncbi:MAG: ATP-binding protein [Candidatus Cloacimonetes bacterium]|nr:ATP-binding protein [Candidatus Cloacimonadota bacterium]
MDNEKSLLTIPADLKYLPALQNFISSLAQLAGLEKRDIEYLSLAVEETVTNVIQHAFQPEENASFELECSFDKLEFSVTIRDKGVPFDPGRYQKYEIDESLSDIAKPGLGFRLIQGSVDRLTYHNLGYGGKEVNLLKFIAQKHIDDYLPEAELEAFPEPTATPARPDRIPYHVEMLKPEQAVEVAQCAYRTYGYTYSLENIYFPERLIQMTQSGDLVSAVIVSDITGEVLSHCALEFYGRRHGIPEIGAAFTKPQFRGMGCINTLNDYLIDFAHRQKLPGIYSKAVTTHEYSQKALAKIAFNPCGILIGFTGRKFFTGMSKNLSQRETLILYYRLLQNYPPIGIYCPPQHREMILSLCQVNNLTVKELEDTISNTGKDSANLSRIDVEVNERLNYVNIHIPQYGQDLLRQILLRVKALAQKKNEAFNIYLDLTNPDTLTLCSELEKNGFFFAGIFPSAPVPYLILQYLNNVYIDYQQLAVNSAYCLELLDYIKDRDPNQQ